MHACINCECINISFSITVYVCSMYPTMQISSEEHRLHKSMHIIIRKPRFQSIKLLILFENVSQAILQFKASKTLHN